MRWVDTFRNFSENVMLFYHKSIFVCKIHGPFLLNRKKTLILSYDIQIYSYQFASVNTALELPIFFQ